MLHQKIKRVKHLYFNLVQVNCAFCGKEFLRENGRYNEAKKFGWRPFCSLGCQYGARTTQVEMRCGNHDCGKMFSRQKNQLKKSKSKLNFCSTRCAAIFNNTLRRKIKNCPVCSAKFYGDRVTCSRDCFISLSKAQPKIEKIPKKEIIREIQNFYKQNFRIPEKRECSFYNTARVKFGSWNKAIELAGFKPTLVKFADKHIADDGHKCNSLSERIIDDWLTANNIEHKREIFYPGNKKLRADFLVNGCWIEFFGLAGGLKDYDKTIKQKLDLVEKYQMPFIAIYPKDLFPVNRLAEILKV